MEKLILIKGESFDSSARKGEIKKIMGKGFNSIEELESNLPGGCYIPRKQSVEIDKLPLTIKQWPVYERKDFSGGSPPGYVSIIAVIKVVE